MFEQHAAWEAIDPEEYAEEQDADREDDGQGDGAHEEAQLANLDAETSESAEPQAELGVAAPEAAQEAAPAEPPPSLEDAGRDGGLVMSAPEGELEDGEGSHAAGDAAPEAGDAAHDEAALAALAPEADHDEDRAEGDDDAGGSADERAAQQLDAAQTAIADAEHEDERAEEQVDAAPGAIASAAATASASAQPKRTAKSDAKPRSTSASGAKAKSPSGASSKSSAASRAKAKAKASAAAPRVRGERTTSVAHKNYFAKRDKFNRPSIKDPKLSRDPNLRKNQIDRPGVRVANRDSFRLAVSPAARYKIASGEIAEQIDVVTSEYIKPTPNAPKGHRLALNPAHSRLLRLPDNTRELCVFVWVGSRGPGWMPIRFIQTGSKFTHADIRKQVDRRAGQWMPAKASEAQMRTAKRHVFIDGDAEGASASDQHAIAHPKRDRKSFILTRQKTGLGNHTSDYLQHVGIKDGRGGRRDYINICMNLPSDGTPPVAIDTTKPGDFFFVPTAKQFRREIAIYQLRGSRSRRRQTWVYGMVGKKDAREQWQPDDRRRGWVPLRTVKKG